MREAKDIMITEICTASPDEPILLAAKRLLENKVSALPVVDKDGVLCGILSEKDLLVLLMTADAKEKRVSELMSGEVIAYRENDSIHMICEFLMENNIRRVPIVDKEGTLKGLISRRDLIREVLALAELFKEF